MRFKNLTIVLVSSLVASIVLFGCDQGMRRSERNLSPGVGGSGIDPEIQAEIERSIRKEGVGIQVAAAPAIANDGTKLSTRIQILDSMANVLQIKPSVEARARYQQKLTSLPVAGTENDVSGPMFLALADVAAQVCDQRIKQEAATQKYFFTALDLSDLTAQPTAAEDQQLRQDLSLLILKKSYSTLDSSVKSDFDAEGAGLNRGDRALLYCTALLTTFGHQAI